ncbi:MAG: hypothetical protein AAF438_19730 [Pseudomonadota bacterium]
MTEALRRGAPTIAAALVILTSLWIYWPGKTGPVLLDDFSSVLVIGNLQQNPELAWDYVRGDDSGPLGRTISMMSFVLESLLFGDSIEIKKQVSILLHLVNGCLVVVLFSLLFRFLAVPGRFWLALILGAAWTLSPLFVSTVLYVVQRMAMLSTTFMLCACIAYVVWRLQLLRGSFSPILMGTVLLCIVLAMFSKENAIVVVPILILMEALWFQFAGPGGKTIAWLRRLTFSLIAIGAAFLCLYLVLKWDTRAAAFGHRYFSLDERLLTQTRILWDYVGQLFIPDVFRMGLYHDDVVVSTSLREPPTTFYAVLAWCGVALAFGLLLFKRWGRYIAFGLAWFLVGHSIESTVFPLELYFEHRNYFPSIGLFLLVGALFAGITRRMIEVGPPLLAYLALTVVWLASLTSSQVQIWSSQPLLILQHLNAHPNSFRANADMAVHMANLGELEAARDYSARAFALSRVERSGDHDIRDLALACIANQPVPPEQIEQLGTNRPDRPFGSVVTLQTMVHLLQDDVCPAFDRLRFANRMYEIYLSPDSTATASANIYLGLALLEHVMQRWNNALAYIDLFLAQSPDYAQGLLMKLHFVTALGKVDEAEALRSQLLELQTLGKLTVSEQQTLSLYLEN